MAENIHTCGTPRLVYINSVVAGDEMFGSLTGVFLSTWVANKKVLILIEGCEEVGRKATGFEFKNSRLFGVAIEVTP